MKDFLLILAKTASNSELSDFCSTTTDESLTLTVSFIFFSLKFLIFLTELGCWTSIVSYLYWLSSCLFCSIKISLNWTGIVNKLLTIVKKPLSGREMDKKLLHLNNVCWDWYLISLQGKVADWNISSFSI